MIDRIRLNERVVIVAGPRCGKSTLARQLRERGMPTYCGDPRSKVKNPEAGVMYAPEGLGMGSESSAHVVRSWFPEPGPWVCEGHIMARALRKWVNELHENGLDEPDPTFPCDRVIVFHDHHPRADVTSEQEAMHAGVIGKTWREIRDYYRPITLHARWLYDWGPGEWKLSLTDPP